MEPAAELKRRFHSLYGGDARVFRAPGRVNLIGEHTDYNDGFVFPAAVGLYTWVAAAPRAERRLRVHSNNFSESVEFELGRIESLPGHWSNYVRGVVAVLEQQGHILQGADLHIRGEVPIGSGLSSSAAVEVAAALALVSTNDLEIDRTELARLCQRAESEFVGMRCGIMDQFIACHARENHALMLDCRSLEYRQLFLSGEARLVICNSGVKHELAGSAYNTRRTQCEQGVESLKAHLAGIRALRDVGTEDLEQHAEILPPLILKRCRHVVRENERVEAAVAALEERDLTVFGRLMNESHRSLRDDYEVSCCELDLLVEIAQGSQGVYGARMTGAGFGGCTVNLVRAEDADRFRERIAREYQDATGMTPDIYLCSAAGGAQEVGV